MIHDVGRTGFALGVVHAALALVAFAVESGGLPDPATNPDGVALVGVSALFTAVVAAPPVGIHRRIGYVTPAVFVAGWFTWGVVGFVRSLGSYPYSASVGVNPLSPPPSPGYLVTWAVPLTAILVLTGLEYGCRRLLDRNSDPTETVGL